MLSTRVSLQDLSCDILERVVFYTVASKDAFLGPPSDLCSILLVSRFLNHKISMKDNCTLYARIFRFKFDSAAPSRRLSQRWLTAKCLASELKQRFHTLQRLRRKDFEPEDLWTCYLMLSENDGKNSTQLEKYGKIREYLDALMRYRIGPHDLAWYKNATLDSLNVAILWMISYRDSITEEHQPFRKIILGILHPFLVKGYQHPSTYAPEGYFELPLCENITSLVELDAGPPEVSEVTHYSHRLRISAPLVTQSALLAQVIRMEHAQNEATFPRNALALPRDRATALGQGVTGPTLEDVMDFHFHNRIDAMYQTPARIDTTFPEDLDDYDGDLGSSGSERHDGDWYRMVGCIDPWEGNSPLRGAVFKIGAMTGRWAGRILLPEIEPFTTMLVNPQFNSLSVPVCAKPLYWDLQEHHCIQSSSPPFHDRDPSYGCWNAWLPQDLQFTQLADALEVQDPGDGQKYRYETFTPGNKAHYPTGVCEKFQTSWTPEEIAEKSPASTPDSSPWSTSIDNDDEWSDSASHLNSGISDILITGKSTERYGESWGHFTLYGRVRAWDGLVVLRRSPRDPTERHLGDWIFKGYVHHQNFVGRWRELSTAPQSVGYEGGFVVSKMESDDGA